jgi:hypothetical protein
MKPTLTIALLLALSSPLSASELLLSITQAEGGPFEGSPAPAGVGIGFILGGIGDYRGQWDAYASEIGLAYEVDAATVAKVQAQFQSGEHIFIPTCNGEYWWAGVWITGSGDQWPSFSVQRLAPDLGPGMSGYTIERVTDTLDMYVTIGEPQPEGWQATHTLRFYGDPIPDLPGDFSHNGVIDAADYVMWRDSYHQPVELRNESGLNPYWVDEEDYNYWRARFEGNGGGAISAAMMAAGSVPEPATAAIVLVTVLFLALRGWVSRGGSATASTARHASAPNTSPVP